MCFGLQSCSFLLKILTKIEERVALLNEGYLVFNKNSTKIY